MGKLKTQFERLLTFTDDRTREILCARIGYYRTPLSLQAIGDHYGITRERIRQIELQAKNYLFGKSHLKQALINSIEAAWRPQSAELPLADLMQCDPWYDEFADEPEQLARVIEYCTFRKYVILRRNDALIIRRTAESKGWNWNRFHIVRREKSWEN